MKLAGGEMEKNEGERRGNIRFMSSVSSTPCQLRALRYARAREKIVDKLSKLMSNAFQDRREFSHPRLSAKLLVNNVSALE